MTSSIVVGGLLRHPFPRPLARPPQDRRRGRSGRKGARKGAIKWTRLSYRWFAANAVRLQLHALAYDLGNFLRTLATPEPMKGCSMATHRRILSRTGRRSSVTPVMSRFQMAEVAIPRNLLAALLLMVAKLRPRELFVCLGSSQTCGRSVS